MSRPTVAKIALAQESASAGVDFSPRHGARCPWCGTARAKIYKTMPWEDDIRIRYHRCKRSGCVLAKMHVSIKSIEVNTVEERYASIKF